MSLHVHFRVVTRRQTLEMSVNTDAKTTSSTLYGFDQHLESSIVRETM